MESETRRTDQAAMDKSRLGFKDQLARKVEALTEFTKAKDLTSKGEHQQQRKCSQCGKTYLGQQNSDTCGPACRVAKHRA